MADLFKKMNDLKDELRPNLKDLENSDSNKVSEPEPKIEPVVSPQSEPELSSEERNELDRDERAAFGEKQSEEPVYQDSVVEAQNLLQVRKKNGNFINSIVPDIENDFNKSKVILQGATNKNPRFGGLIPWSTTLAKIETPDEKQILRGGKEALLGAAILFGKDSDFVSCLWEDYNGEIMFTRANMGFASKLEKTQISQTFTDKNVKTSRNSSGKDGFMNSIQPAYGQ